MNAKHGRFRFDGVLGRFVAWSAGLFLALASAAFVRSELILDDDFSVETGYWQSEGSVVRENGRVVLSEGSVLPILWFGGEVSGYLHEVRFDVFLGGLSLVEGSGSMDRFRIMVHAGEDPATISPEVIPSSGVILEVTGEGSQSGLSTAVIVPNIAKGDGWYSGVVEVGISEPAAALSFSLADNNAAIDSFVSVDSIRVTVIARGRLSNISNRGDALTGNKILITGFVMRGTESKSLLVRAMGPRLESPFNVQGFLVDPKLDLFPGGVSTSIATNNDWQDVADVSGLKEEFARLGAYPFETGSKDSAMMVRDLAPISQGYTIWVSGVNAATGVALAEVYAADSGADGPTELVNISSRGPIGEGSHRPILGWVVEGERGRKILARAMGPTLEAPSGEGGFGLSGFVDDPVLEIYQIRSDTNAKELVYTNDDWGLADNAAEVPVVGADVGAFAPVAGSKDAIVLASLSPGIYTAVARSKNGEQGLALVELYVVTGNRRPVASNNLVFVPTGVQSILPVEPLIANYIDPDNDVLVIVSYGQPSQGELTRNEAGDFVYTPPSGFIGETLFSYTVSDGEYESLPATVALQVAPAKIALWIGGSEGNFSDSSNWKDGVVPGPEDTVWLADIDKDFTVNLDMDASIKAMRVGGAGANVVFKMTSGRSLSVAEGIDVQNGSGFVWNSGTLTTTGDFSIAGNLHWSGGSMSGVGETIIEAGGSALIDGNVNLYGQRKFTNKGAVVQTGSNNIVADGSAEVTITNAGGASWTTRDRNNHSIAYAPNGGNTITFNNIGSLVVESSTSIGGGYGVSTLINSGIIEIASGQTFTISSGNQSFAAGGSSTGSGLLLLNGGVLDIAGAASVTSLRMDGGTLMVDSAPLTVAAMTQTGGTVNGTKTLTVTGSLNWSGGIHIGSGTTVVGDAATAQINNNVNLYGHRRFTNEGALVQTGSNNIVADGSAEVTITNAGGASWTTRDRNNHSIAYAPNGGNTITFNNIGSLVVESSTSIGGGYGSTVLNNSGLIEVKTGTFICNANAGTQSGDLAVSLGSSLVFASGAHTLEEGIQSTGSGRLTVAGSASVTAATKINVPILWIEGGRLTLASGSHRVADFVQTAGTLTGEGVVTVTGVLAWSGGTQSGSGTTVVGDAATALIDGNVNLYGQRKFTNEGAVVQTGSNNIVADGSAEVTITNAGGASWTTRDRNNHSIAYAPNGGNTITFNNIGSLVVESSTSIGGGYGSTVLNNSGLIDVKEGALGLSGVATTLQSSSKLKLTSTGSAAITGSGNLTLAGTLEVFWAEGYTPASAAVIPLINYASRSGTFSSVTVPPDRTITHTDYGATLVSITLN